MRLTCVASLLCLSFSAFAQSRINRTIDNSHRTFLAGHLHPKATLEADQGRVSPSMEVTYVTLSLAQTDAQKADLEQLLTDQQNPASPNYHRWLTPEDYARRFGASEADINQITAWLQSQGLTVAAVARGRNWISANGSAAQVETAFQTELHHYLVNGVLHFANATEPSIPAALDGVVRSIHGLHDFRAHPAKRTMSPDYTSSRGNHYLSPDDLATVYNIHALHQAGLTGSGQKIVVAGQTQINLSDIQLFRTNFNLAANDPQITLIPNSKDPGIVDGDLSEADLDLEWAGAIARDARILYVYAPNVMDAVQYAIDQNMAPVLSVSYGLCEAETPSSDLLTFRTWARQGNSQGITWFNASGDAGGADCNDSQNPGLSVDAPASIPEVTGVGGTELSEGAGLYWNATNDGNKASVTGYISEVVWNDSVADGSPSASGGGASTFFAKPSWQTGTGVPSDNARHVPDVSLNASADHDGYMVYTGGALSVYGGTSVPTPVFAGIIALINQSTGSAGLGNINPKLYSLAQTSPAVFHDVVTGDNIVTVACKTSRIRICSNSAVGFSAGAGYDQATGLGSVDAFKLVNAWGGAVVVTPPAPSIALLSNRSAIGVNDVIDLTATVVGSDGVTPTGNVIFSVSGTQLGSAALVGSAGTATATLVVKGSQFPQGSGTVSASYGSSTAASLTVTVATGTSSNAVPAVTALVNPASYQPSAAPGGILSIFGSQLAPSTQPASAVPLPLTAAGVQVLVNGVAAPLYYVSPGLVNLQVPYETQPGATTVTINNNGQVASGTFTIPAAAPAIFADQNGLVVPTNTATRGQEIAMYITGAGAVTPAVATGAPPASNATTSTLPKPLQNSSVKIGNVTATIDFIGIPPGLVGVTQVNFTVPSSAIPGTQSLIVTIGGIASAPVKLIVN